MHYHAQGFAVTLNRSDSVDYRPSVRSHHNVMYSAEFTINKTETTEDPQRPPGSRITNLYSPLDK